MGARHRVRALRKNLHEAEKAERQQPQKIKLQDTVGDTAIIDDETYTATTELIELVQLARDAGGQLTLADARHQLALSEIEVECMVDEAVLQTVHGTRTVTQDAFVKNNSSSIVLTSATEQVLASQQGKVFVNL